MKKNLIYILGFFLCFMLPGCGKPKSNIIIKDYCNSNGFLSQTSDIVESDSGYFFLSGKANEKHIQYLDKKTNNTSILCSKINCNHSNDNVSKDCDSYVGEVLVGSLNYYNNYIYYIEYNSDNYKCTLYKVSANGSEHKKICTLGNAPDNSNSYYSYVVTNNNVIFSESIGTINKSNTSTLKIYSISNKSFDTIYSFDSNNSQIFDLKVNNDYIFFRQATNGELFDSQLMAYEINKNLVNLLTDSVCSYSIINENTVVYWRSYDGIYKKYIDTNEISKLYNSDDDTMLGYLAVTENNCYVYNFSNGAYKKDTSIFIGILNNNEIISKKYVNDGEFIMPLYVGQDRIIISIYGQAGRNIGYCLTQNKTIDSNVQDCNIKY